MAARPSATVSIPRFLLPQLTWRAPHLRPTAALPSAHPRRGARQQRRQERSLHASAAQYAQFTSKHQQQEVDWAVLSKLSKQQLQQPGGGDRTRLTKSLYRALRASLEEAAAPSFSSVISYSPLPSTFLPHGTFATASAGSPFFSQQQQQRQQRWTQARAFSTTVPRQRDHHFDTLKFVQRLKDEGFSEEQATAMMRVLSDVIEESIQNLTRTMVLREEAERATYTQKVDFTKLRSELLSSDNAEASLTRASHDRMANDLAKINSRLRDEISRTQASVRLDLNLEKGRIREEANVQELKIKETEARIEQEVAGLRERVEGVKFGTLQWLMGVCTGTAAIILGAWRLLM